MERVWVRYGECCKRYVVVDGRLDLDRIASAWSLNPTDLYVSSESLTYDGGKSLESIEQIREWLSGDAQDGRSRDTAFVVEAGMGSKTPLSHANLQDCLTSLQQDVRKLLTEGSRTRSASKIAVEDFSVLRKALKVVVLYEDIDGKKVKPDILESLLGDDKFWNKLYERQEKDKYIAEVKRWVPEVGICWADVDGHTIRRRFPDAPFSISGQNGQLAFVEGLDVEQGALLGLELKRKVLTMKGLRQAEVYFYLWGDVSLFPFVQVITDMQKGGVAVYCRSRGSELVLVQVVLRNMDEVKRFTQKVLSDPPSTDDAHYEDTPSERLEPSRKRFRPLEEPESRNRAESSTFGDASSSRNFAARFLDNDVANLADLECFESSQWTPHGRFV